MAGESGVQRAERFRAKAAAAQAEADKFRRMAEACEKGAVGEGEVGRILDVLEGSGWRILNDRFKAAGSTANIDHIAVGPPGVCVIDAKNWSGGPVHLDERGMAHRGRRRDAELIAAKDAADAVLGHARRAHAEVIVVPALAFLGDAGPGTPTFHEKVLILRADQLLPWLTTQRCNLTPQQVRQVSSALDAALPPRTGASRPLTVPTTPLRPPAGRGPRARSWSDVAPRPLPPRTNRQSRTGGPPTTARWKKIAAGAFVLFVVVPALLDGTDRVPSGAPQPGSTSPSAVLPAP